MLVGAGVHWQPFSEGALRELPPVASSAQYVVPPAELAARRDLRGPEYLICRWVGCWRGQGRLAACNPGGCGAYSPGLRATRL